MEDDSIFTESYRKKPILTRSAPNSPQSQRKLLGSQKTANGLRKNMGQLGRAHSLSDIFSKADFDKSGSNLTRIRKLSVGSVEVLRGVGLNDTAKERERKFVAKYSNAEQVIEHDISKTTTIRTQKGKTHTQNQTIITSNVQRKIVTQSSVQQTITSKTKSRSLDDQHITKYRNRPVILQRKRSLGSIEISRQQMMKNQQNKEIVLPPQGRIYRSTSEGAIKQALQNAGMLNITILINIFFDT